MSARPTKPFVAAYYHKGSWWITTIYAFDFEDAEARCKKLGMRLHGELVVTTPVGWAAKAWCWFANIWRSK